MKFATELCVDGFSLMLSVAGCGPVKQSRTSAPRRVRWVTEPCATPAGRPTLEGPVFSGGCLRISSGGPRSSIVPRSSRTKIAALSRATRRALRETGCNERAPASNCLTQNATEKRCGSAYGFPRGETSTTLRKLPEHRGERRLLDWSAPLQLSNLDARPTSVQTNGQRLLEESLSESTPDETTKLVTETTVVYEPISS